MKQLKHCETYIQDELKKSIQYKNLNIFSNIKQHFSKVSIIRKQIHRPCFFLAHILTVLWLLCLREFSKKSTLKVSIIILFYFDTLFDILGFLYNYNFFIIFYSSYEMKVFTVVLFKSLRWHLFFSYDIDRYDSICC